MTEHEDNDVRRTDQNGPQVVEPIMDLYLRLFLDVLGRDSTNQSSFGLTLTVPGGLVSGTAISHGAYMEATDALLRDAGSNGGMFLADYLDAITQQLDELQDPEELKEFPRMIHLKDVRIIAGNRTMHSSLWRGRLADVVGWSFGTLSDE
ncbi:hypothetical protein ACFWV1_18690 [Streptomyces sp. NPDC058700]|uniref:hypothetical protein n=1 Tax=unclassified Streptomyces TaxID=2593676 RepID=UPI003651DB23